MIPKSGNRFSEKACPREGGGHAQKSREEVGMGLWRQYQYPFELIAAGLSLALVAAVVTLH
jgi:NADH:ubiquinone oxidoreductase subunit 6 (subunit J)